MPLKQGSSHEVVGENVKREMQQGKPQPQAVAIALKEAGLSNQDDERSDKIKSASERSDKIREAAEKAKKNRDEEPSYKSAMPETVTLAELNRQNQQYYAPNVVRDEPEAEDGIASSLLFPHKR